LVTGLPRVVPHAKPLSRAIAQRVVRDVSKPPDLLAWIAIKADAQDAALLGCAPSSATLMPDTAPAYPGDPDPDDAPGTDRTRDLAATAEKLANPVPLIVLLRQTHDLTGALARSAGVPLITTSDSAWHRAGRAGELIVGAANHPELLDPALVQPGRFYRMKPHGDDGDHLTDLFGPKP
jgi:hypothetical protein